MSKAAEAGGEAARTVNSVKQGVSIGTKLGGAHGAAVGAVAGGVKAVAQSKHRKKVLIGLVCLLIPNLLLAALLLLPLAALGSTSQAAQVDTLAMSRSRDAGGRHRRAGHRLRRGECPQRRQLGGAGGVGDRDHHRR